jgi:hypothetical protein
MNILPFLPFADRLLNGKKFWRLARAASIALMLFAAAAARAQVTSWSGGADQIPTVPFRRTPLLQLSGDLGLYLDELNSGRLAIDQFRRMFCDRGVIEWLSISRYTR